MKSSQNYKIQNHNYEIKSQTYEIKSQNYKIKSHHFEFLPNNSQAAAEKWVVKGFETSRNCGVERIKPRWQLETSG